MHITVIGAAAAFAAAFGALTPAHAASPGTATCFNRGLKFVGGPVQQGAHTVLGACRGATDHHGGDVWRAYGTINIGRRAPYADRCRIRIRSTWNGRASRPRRRNCAAALNRRGVTFTYYGHNSRFSATEACYVLSRGSRRVQGDCVTSRVVEKLLG
jgi:hypothetical protein